MVETITKVKKAASQLLHENGHDPSPEEIASKLNMPVDKVRDIMRVAQDPVSLETPIGEEEDSHLGDFIPLLLMLLLTPCSKNSSMRYSLP